MAVFGWLHACSTRNAGMIYIYLEKMLKHKVSGQGVSYVGARMTAGTYEGQPNAGSSVQGLGHKQSSPLDYLRKSQLPTIQLGWANKNLGLCKIM